MFLSLTVYSLLHLLPAPLSERLGSAQFRQREAAHRALAHLGRLALPALEHAVRSHSSAEARRRCEALLAPYAWELAYRDAGRLRSPMPWIDSRVGGFQPPVVVECWDWVMKARSRGCKRFGEQGGEDYPDYREATRLWVASQLLQRRPLSEINHALDLLQGMEIVWKASHK